MKINLNDTLRPLLFFIFIPFTDKLWKLKHLNTDRQPILSNSDRQCTLSNTDRESMLSNSDSPRSQILTDSVYCQILTDSARSQILTDSLCCQILTDSPRSQILTDSLYCQILTDSLCSQIRNGSYFLKFQWTAQSVNFLHVLQHVIWFQPQQKTAWYSKFSHWPGFNFHVVVSQKLI
jgi:hypothetical protein